MKKVWQGVWVAVVTPFRGGDVDISALERLTDRLLKAGVSGIVPCGTTGEGGSLDDADFSRVVETVLARVQRRVPVVPGTGSNNTERTVARTSLARKLGADGALVVTPYYVRPTQEGLRRHFQTVSDQADLPLLLYNVPSRTAVNLLPETVERIVGESNVGGIKDCAPLPQIAELIGRVGGKISVLSGEDGVFLPFLSIGGDGIVSVVANVVPEAWVDLFRAHSEKDPERAQAGFLKHARLTELLFVEPNPLPVKAALEMLGLIGDEFRLPLVPLSGKHRPALRAELASLGMVAA
jgi:4-hydroxy-tetrahydrodipicolinate synthase